jgi:histidinol-phosphate aminotransferase
MLARTAKPPRKVFEELLARDILIRDVSRYPMLSSYVRVSVGSPEENDRLVAALKDVMSRLSS